MYGPSPSALLPGKPTDVPPGFPGAVPVPQIWFAYRPADVLPQITAEIVVVRRTTPGDEDETGVGDAVPAGARVVDVTAPGHNLLRYRPDEVTAAILGG